MKRLLKLSLLSILFLIITIVPVKAAYDFNKNSGLEAMGKTSDLNTSVVQPETYIGTILTLLFSFLGIIFLVLIVYAGILWSTAQGNTSQVEKAKDTITRSIVGLILVILAYAISIFIMTLLRKTPAPIIDSPVNVPSNNPADYQENIPTT